MPLKTLRKIPARNVTQQAIAQLRELVLSGAYRPGERLPSERDLQEALGVSRTVIRECLRGLEALDLVVVRHGSGVFVAEGLPGSGQPATLPFRLKTAQELIEVRLMVEPYIAAYAALRATPAELERLRSDVERFRAEIGVVKRPPTDLRFHLDLCRAVHNRSLLVIFQWIIDFYAKSGQVPNAKDVTDHAEICEAVHRRDGDAANAAMRRHLEWVKEQVTQESVSDDDPRTGRGG
ncbi:MAG TPA: FadR/GntR family transcriptional regulator [Tepidiformaceae bacterium]|nr:FadR/GntR family transcriptional regulator [Tepidiformaceae bacterium]